MARISESDSSGCAATSRVPLVAFERLKRDGDGDVVLQLKSAWRRARRGAKVQRTMPGLWRKDTA